MVYEFSRFHKKKKNRAQLVMHRILLAVASSFFLTIAGPAFALPDWVLTIEDPGQDGLPAGSTLVYEVEIRNDAQDPVDVAPESTITFNVTPGTTFVGGGGLADCTPLGVLDASVTCTVPEIPANGSFIFNPEILTTSAGAVTLAGSIPSAGDSNSANNSSSQPTTVLGGSDIALSLSGPVNVPSGDTATFTFTATNNGPNASNGFNLNFPAPVGLQNIVVPPNCIVDGPNYVCAIPGVVSVNQSVSVDFSGQVTVGEGSTIGVSGSVAGASPADGVSDNNLAEWTANVTAGSDLSISKSVSSNTLLVGDTAQFTISPRYSGDDPFGITVTDLVPPNYLVLSVDTTSTPFDCSATSGNAINCSLASGGSSGANVSLGDIVVEVLVLSATTGTNVENVASITSDGPVDPNSANNASGDGGVKIEDPFVDHAISKTGPNPLLVAVGSTYEYRLGSTNVGNADFVGTLQIVDTVPLGMTITSAVGPGWTCSPVGNVVGPAQLTCTIEYTQANPLPSGAATPSIVTQVLATEEGPLPNTAEVSATIANIEDFVGGNNKITVTSTGDAADESPDVEILKSASETSLLAGEIQTFTLEVVNNGTLGGDAVNAEGVVITDRIGTLINNVVAAGGGIENITLDQAGTDLNCGTTDSGSIGVLLSCTISVLPTCPTGSCPTITIQARPGGNPQTGVSNTAEVRTTGTADSDPNNNIATVFYDIGPQTDVSVKKTATPSPAIVGQDVLYTITALNQPEVNGEAVVLSTAENVTVIDTVPDNMVFVSVSVSGGGVCTTALEEGDTTSGDTVSCTWSAIDNQDQQIVNLVLRPKNETLANPPIAPSTAPGIENSVTINTTTAETDTTNNTASAPIDLVEPSFDLIVNKTDDIDPVGIAQQVTYTVRVTNAGPSAAENVTIVDQMPASRLAFDSVVDPADGSCSVTNAGTPSLTGLGELGVEVTCVVPYLAAGASTSFDILAFGDRRGSTVNNVSVSADRSATNEINTSSDTASQRTNVRTRVDLTVNSKVATPSVVNLGEDFLWTIEVENLAGSPGDFFGEAVGVVVSDILPSGLELTGPPTAVGTSFIDCGSADAGDTSFECTVGDFDGVEGTMASGEIIQISVPVRAVSVTTDSQSFENTATIEATDSYEPNQTNNSSSGTVIVNAGSISGTIFRDFNDDGVQDPLDSNVNVVQVTLAGTDLNGNAINRTIDTTDGTYNFGLLPEGSYVVTRGPISEAYQTDGKHVPGVGETPLDNTTVSPTIALSGNEDAPNYDFAIVPQARIGLAKRILGGPILNANGSVDLQFQFVIENFSLEELSSIALDDPLEGTAPLFGTYVASNVTSARGQYTIASGPTSTCGGANGTFTGAGTDTKIVTGAVIAAETSCQVEVRVRVFPTDPFPSGSPNYENTAAVDGVGTLSGQTSTENPFLADISDNGTDPDQNNDGNGAGSNEDDPTPANVDFNTSIFLEKTVDTSAIANPAVPVAGEVLTYTYTVTNPSAFNVFDIEVTENAPGPQLAGNPPNFSGTGTPPLIGAPVGGADIDGEGDLVDLAPGGTITYTANYTITQDDIHAGFVLNTASLTATDVYGEPLEDFSDDPVSGGEDYNSDGVEDDPTVVSLPQLASIDLIKSADTSGVSTPAQAGDEIAFTFTVENTGNLNLDQAAAFPVDTMNFGSDGAGAVVAPGLVVTRDAVNSTDNNDGILQVGEVITYTASYVVDQASIDAGGLFNTATSVADPVDESGSALPIASVTTTSDNDTSGNGKDGPADGNGNNPTSIPLTPVPSIDLLKSAAASLSDPVMVGDEIVFTFTVENTGNVNLDQATATPVDVMKYGSAGSGAEVTPALVVARDGVNSTDNNDGILQIGEVITYMATFAIDQDAIDAGGILNTATSIADPVDENGNDLPAINSVVATSDNDTSGDGEDGVPDSSGNNPTSIPVPQNPSVEVVKSATAGPLLPDGTFDVTFALETTNTGNVTLNNLTLVDDLATQYGTGVVVSVVTQPSVSAGPSDPASVSPGAPTTPYTGGATSLIGTGGSLAAGDSYAVTFTVKLDATTAPSQLTNTANTGGTPPATDTNPTPASITDNSENGPETTDDGDPVTPEVSDGTPNLSDPDDTDIPTVITPPIAEGEIALVKTAVLNDDDGTPGVSAGDTIDYTYTITNTDTVLNALNVTVTEDAGVFNGSGPLPTPVLDNNGSDLDGGGNLNDLAPGASLTFSATYTVTQTDIDAGGVINQATADAVDPFGNDLTDISDDDVAGPDNDETAVSLAQTPSMELVKTATVGTLLPDGSFDVTFALTASNTGNVTLNDLTLVDDLTTQYGVGIILSVVSQPSVTAAPSEPASVSPSTPGVTYTGGATPLIGSGGVLIPGDSYTVEFTVNLDATAAPTQLINTATTGGTPPATDSNPVPAPISDNSENGVETTDDGNPTTAEVGDGTPDTSDPNDINIPTVVTPPVDAGSIAVVKAAALDQNVAGGPELNVGDQIIYVYTVTNTHRVLNALNVSFLESATDFSGDFSQLTVPVKTSGGVDIDGSGGANDLAAGESLTFTATYTIQQADIDAGLVDNQASADATDPFGNALSDLSDNNTSGDGEDGDDNSTGGTGDSTGDNNPTSVPLVGVASLGLVKTLVEPIPSVFTDVAPNNRLFYEFAVTNTGTITIPGTDVVTIADNRIASGNLSCPAIPAAGLPPLDADGDGTDEPLVDGVNLITCTGFYDIVTADIDIGSVINIATANTATTGDSPIDDAIFPLDATPALTVEKKAIAGADFDAVGDLVTYEYVITNTGGAAFTQPVSLTDDKPLTVLTTNNGTAPGTPVAAGAPFTCWAQSVGDTSFAPDPNFDTTKEGEEVTCTATYAVTQADLDAGEVTNVVEAQTSYPGPSGVPVISAPVDETVEAEQLPAMVLTKTATPGAVNADGTFEAIFALKIANTGNVTLHDLTLVDDLIAQYGAGVVTGVVSQPIVTVAPTDPSSVNPGGPSVGYSGGATPLIGSGGVLAVGDSMTVSFTVTLDPTGLPKPISLANTATTGARLPDPADGSTPGTISDNSENGAVVLDDGDASTPTVSDGTDPNPSDSDTDVPTIIGLNPVGELGIVKTSVFNDNDGTPGASVGDTITYTYTVTNLSSFLNALNVTVTEDAGSFSGAGTLPVPAANSDGSTIDGTGTLNDLAPGGSLTYSATYTITQDDIDTGAVENRANAAGTDPFGNDLEDFSDDATAGDADNDPTVTLLTRTPTIELVKSVADVADTNGNGLFGDAGDTVNYNFFVTNTGNVALADLSVTDMGFGSLGGTAVLTQIPDVTLAVDEGPVLVAMATYVLAVSDIETGSATNTARVEGTPVETDGAGNPDPSAPLTGTPNATDTSDTGSAPLLEEDTGAVTVIADPAGTGTGDDPTVLNLPVLTAGIELTKSVANVADTNGNGVFGDPGDIVNYRFTVTNTGNVGLADITVTDTDLDALDGIAVLTQLPDVTLAIGESNVLAATATYVLTPNDYGAGSVTNSAAVEGTPVATDSEGNPDPSAPIATVAPATDTSDTGTDPALDAETGTVSVVADPAGTGSGDDPTIITLPVLEPSIELVKTVKEVTDTNSNGLFGDPGNTVNYDFIISNTGDAALAGITVTDIGFDALTGVSSLTPNPDFDGTLARNEGPVLAATATYVVTDDDRVIGSITNIAAAQGTPVATDTEGNPDPSAPLPGFNPVTDTSDAGNEPTLDEQDGTVPSIDGPASVGTGNDPTIIALPTLEPQLELIKSVEEVADTNGNGLFGDPGDTVHYNFTVTNTGTAALAGIIVTDSSLDALGGMANFTSDPIFDGTLALNEGPVLAATATYVLTQTDLNTGSVTNVATVEAVAVETDSDGNPDPDRPMTGLDPVTDTSDTGTEPDLDSDDGSVPSINDPSGTGTGDDPTVLYLPELDAGIELIKSVSSVEDTNNSGLFGDLGDTVNFVFTVTNTGNVAFAKITVADSGFDALDGISTLKPNPDFDGTLAVGAGPLVAARGTYVLAQTDLDTLSITNTATTKGTPVETAQDGRPNPDAPLTSVDPVTDTSDTGSAPNMDEETGNVPQISDPSGTGTGDDPTTLILPDLRNFQLILAKTTPVRTVILGDTVPYTITIQNLGPGLARNVTVIDSLPSGMGFVPGTAEVDGVSFVPEVTGRSQAFSGLDVAVNQTITIQLMATVLPNATAGDLTNVATAIDPETGQEVAAPATATVERLPEAVFDCSNVIGKVFDDRNFNGYQDPAHGTKRSPIVINQDVLLDKYEGLAKPLPAPPKGEPGLPGVRLVSPTGTIITTDEFGRYSVPCAELAGQMGTNFTLKLDPRSLPTGYRITTENPRTMRLTAGVATEMNFGAALGRVLDVDLTAAAFVGNNPVDRLDTGLVRLLRQVADTPSIVRISYFTNGESKRVARARINAVEELIAARWRDIGRYRLIVETTIKHLQ